jgi:hypothetical protein
MLLTITTTHWRQIWATCCTRASNGSVPGGWAESAHSQRREFALGIEALERFVREEPLRRVHECVLGVLALESEPVDPRL